VEFLPLALTWLDEGVLWERYEALQKRSDATCFAFRPHITQYGGLCNAYLQRGLICRLFGYSARINKEGQKELVTCKVIKEGQAPAIEKSQWHPKSIPVMTHYYSRMASIDLQLNDRLPINQAMMKAIETVGAYYAYRRRRKKKLDS